MPAFDITPAKPPPDGPLGSGAPREMFADKLREIEAHGLERHGYRFFCYAPETFTHRWAEALASRDLIVWVHNYRTGWDFAHITPAGRELMK